MTHYLDLDFAAPKKGDLPGPPISRIYVKTMINGKYISPVCVSLREFEHEIDRLHDEIETIRSKAKKLYGKKR